MPKFCMISLSLSLAYVQGTTLSTEASAENVSSANLDAKSSFQSVTTTSSSPLSSTQVSQTDSTAITTSSCSPIVTNTSSSITSEAKNQPKRLHVSNIPFRFRDPDLRAMFGVSKRLASISFSRSHFLLVLIN